MHALLPPPSSSLPFNPQPPLRFHPSTTSLPLLPLTPSIPVPLSFFAISTTSAPPPPSPSLPLLTLNRVTKSGVPNATAVPNLRHWSCVRLGVKRGGGIAGMEGGMGGGMKRGKGKGGWEVVVGRERRGERREWERMERKIEGREMRQGIKRGGDRKGKKGA